MKFFNNGWDIVLDDEFKKELPMEYAVELNQLIKMDMEGSVGQT